MTSKENELVEEMDTSDSQNPAHVAIQIQTHFCLFHRVNLVYSCEFVIPEEAQSYYYHPPSAMFRGRKPILEGSPIFGAPWRTKWQVAMTCHRWIHTQRWMSLYLSNLSSAPVPNLKIACEFRIVNDAGELLKSKSNIITNTCNGQTRGFTKFLPFSDISKYITDKTRLLLEAHIMLLSTTPPNEYHDTIKEGTYDDVRPEANVDKIPKPPAPPFPSHVFPVHDEDRLEFGLDGQFIGFVSRKLFIDASIWYKDLTTNSEEPENESFWKSVEFRSNAHSPLTAMAIQQCIQFLNEDNCDALVSGSYNDVMNVLVFAVFVQLESMIIACLKAAIHKVDIQSAIQHCGVVHKFEDLISPEELEDFRKFLRKNFYQLCEVNAIPDSEDWRNLVTRLLLDPNMPLGKEPYDASIGDPD